MGCVGTKQNLGSCHITPQLGEIGDQRLINFKDHSLRIFPTMVHHPAMEPNAKPFTAAARTTGRFQLDEE
jgi:hypothetical protein